MNQEEIIKSIVDVAKRIKDLKPSELAIMVPNRELREAILDIYGAGWDEGLRVQIDTERYNDIHS